MPPCVCPCVGTSQSPVHGPLGMPLDDADDPDDALRRVALGHAHSRARHDPETVHSAVLHEGSPCLVVYPQAVLGVTTSCGRSRR